jgi:hypothetical protein
MYAPVSDDSRPKGSEVVPADARLIERWRPGDARPELLTERLEWRPDVAQPTLTIDLPAYSAAVCGE